MTTHHSLSDATVVLLVCNLRAGLAEARNRSWAARAGLHTR